MSSSYDIKCKVIEEELRSVWPEWHVAGRLGGGGFGDVYQIYREKDGIREDSALKVIQISNWETTVILPFNQQIDRGVEAANQSDIPDAILSEIQIMVALRGAPNIVIIEDFSFKKDESNRTLFVRMELLTCLQDILLGRSDHGIRSSILEIIKLGRDICTALMHCEKKGIIHRDIKPANLFVDEFGHYKVGDFGASKRMDTVHIARTMTGIGAISYMAPEIFKGRPYNSTVDIYSLGLVLYQLLNNGRMPFLPEEGSYTTQDIDSANYRRLNGTPLPTLVGKSVGGEMVDSRLDTVVRKACAINPSDRYQTAKEFYQALSFEKAKEERQEDKARKQREEEEKKRQEAKERKQREEEERRRQEIEKRKQCEEEERKRQEAEERKRSEENKRKQQKGAKREGRIYFIIVLLLIILSVVALSVLVMSLGDILRTSISDSVSEYDRAPRQISDSWEEIIAAGEDGTYIDKYKIEDTKELDLGEEGVIEMELVAFDADELADGSGKAHMTWIAKDLMYKKHHMNYGTQGDSWPASKMRAWLRESVLPLFPETLQSNIREVKKYSYSHYDRTTISSSDTIWIPSRREVVGADTAYENEGPEYITVFPDNASRKKRHTDNNSDSRWWLRSASSVEGFCIVSSDGSISYSYASSAYGVVVGFCL